MIIALFFGLAVIVTLVSVLPHQRGDPQGADPVAGSAGSEARVPLETGKPWDEVDDPKRDGWDTEVFTEVAMKQLNALGGMMTGDGGELVPSQMGEIVAGEFVCERFRPSEAKEILDDGQLRTVRLSAPLPEWNPGEAEGVGPALTFQGAEGFIDALGEALIPFSGASEVRFKAKIFRVSFLADEIATRQYLSLSGRTESGAVEQHVTLDIGWERPSADQLPRMRWLRVREFEQTELHQSEGALFADCTGSVLGGNANVAPQFLRGMNHWFGRIQVSGLLGTPGLALGDVNGDGLDDLYVCEDAGLPNRLFIQNADGSAHEASAAWGVDWLQSSRSALFIDLDNDGDQDLAVAIFGGVVVAENIDNVGFRLRDVLKTGEDTMSLSAVDYDLDGFLDLYVCVYSDSTEIGSGLSGGIQGALTGAEVHDANTGGHNVLFRNLAAESDAFKFGDVTNEVGLEVNNHRFSLAAAWDDFDNDGDQDLYVANDFGRDHLYRNEGGRAEGPVFVDISDPARVEDSATGMSAAWADYDRDGWMDMLVGNMWSSAGKRIAYQEKFRPLATDEVKRRIQRLSRGNSLLRNNGDGTFDDESAAAGVEMGRWAWGTKFVDFNNDGWEDIMVANGYITTDDTGDL